VSPGAVAEADELSQEEEEGKLGSQALVVVGPTVFWLTFGFLQQKSGIVGFQQTPVFPFSLRSTEVEMLERGITCLGRGVSSFSEAVICCPGFPRCFPESRPWELNLSVVSSVGRALLRLCPSAEVFVTAWCSHCPCVLRHLYCMSIQMLK